MEPLIPDLVLPDNPLTSSEKEWAEFVERRDARLAKKKDILRRYEIERFGSVSEFDRDGGKVVYLRTLAGGHDYIGTQEGVQDAIGRQFDFF